jgi:hypothetical protein
MLSARRMEIKDVRRSFYNYQLQQGYFNFGAWAKTVL